MVKGTSKRIVVVKSPDPKVFEQAIFIVREDYLHGKLGRADALKEAQRVADDYIRSAVTRPGCFLTRIPPLAWVGVGIVATVLGAVILANL